MRRKNKLTLTVSSGGATDSAALSRISVPFPSAGDDHKKRCLSFNQDHLEKLVIGNKLTPKTDLN